MRLENIIWNVAQFGPKRVWRVTLLFAVHLFTYRYWTLLKHDFTTAAAKFWRAIKSSVYDNDLQVQRRVITLYCSLRKCWGFPLHLIQNWRFSNGRQAISAGNERWPPTHTHSARTSSVALDTLIIVSKIKPAVIALRQTVADVFCEHAVGYDTR